MPVFVFETHEGGVADHGRRGARGSQARDAGLGYQSRLGDLGDPHSRCLGV
jgi:hypothetical protein